MSEDEIMKTEYEGFWRDYTKDIHKYTTNLSFNHAASAFVVKKRARPKCREDFYALMTIRRTYLDYSDFNMIMNAVFFKRTRNQGLLIMKRLASEINNDDFNISFPAQWQAKMLAVKEWTVENGCAGSGAEELVYMRQRAST